MCAPHHSVQVYIIKPLWWVYGDFHGSSGQDCFPNCTHTWKIMHNLCTNNKIFFLTKSHTIFLITQDYCNTRLCGEWSKFSVPWGLNVKELEESCNENELFEINIVGFRSHETLMLWVKEWHFYKSCKENNSFEMNIKTLWHEVSNNMTDGHSEPTPTIAPSTGCLLLLSCGWTSTELIFGFTLVTNSVGNRSHT